MLSSFVTPSGRRRAADEDGLSLIEVLVAGFVLAVAVLGLASVASTSLVSVRDSRERDRATAAASTALETARALDYDDIALRTGDGWTNDPLVQPNGDQFELDHDGDGSFTERLWASGSGEIYPYTCRSGEPGCWFAMPTDARVTVRTFVSWFEEDGEPIARRVTAVAVWEDPAFTEPRTVWMSTVVAPSTSGLPAPAFEVIPRRLDTSLDDIALDRTVDGDDGPYGYCFEHTITNYGADDSYDVVLDPAGGWTPLDPAGSGTYRNEHWVFRAFFVPLGEQRGTGTLMVADPGNPERPLDSPTGLETGESAGIHFCYARRSGDDGGARPSTAGSPYEYTPRVRSKFDPEVFEEVEHEIEIIPALRLYLHYEQNELGELLTWRPVRAQAAVTVDADLLDGLSLLDPLLGDTVTVEAYLFERFAMSPTGPEARSSLPDYDLHVEHDGDLISLEDLRLNRPGLFLPREAILVDDTPHTSELFAAEWDYHFDADAAPITVADARINLWATRFGGEEPRATAEYCVNAELVKYELQPDGSLSTDPTVVGATTQRFAVPDQDDNAPQGFRRLSVPEFTVPLTGDATFREGDVIRLRVWNAGYLGGALLGVDCVTFHIGFGVDVGGGGDPPAFAATLDLTSEVP